MILFSSITGESDQSSIYVYRSSYHYHDYAEQLNKVEKRWCSPSLGVYTCCINA